MVPMKLQPIATALVTAGLLLVPAVPAAAHGTLISSTPGAGAIITVQPTKIVLRFDEAIVDLAGANVISVHDSVGKELATGHIKVSGQMVTQALVNTAALGKVTIAWKAWCSSGHLVTGTYTVTLTTAAVAEAAAKARTQALARAKAKALIRAKALARAKTLTSSSASASP